MNRCTKQEWTDFLAQFDCHGTEPNPTAFVHVHNVTGEVLGCVVYHPGLTYPNDRTYFINVNVTSPTLHGHK